MGIERPLNAIGRAKFSGEVVGAGRMDDQQLLLLPRHLLNGESDGRHWNIEDHVDVLTIVPLPRDLRADIGLELMIGGNDFDGLAGNLAAKVGDRHLRRRDRALALASEAGPDKSVSTPIFTTSSEICAGAGCARKSP